MMLDTWERSSGLGTGQCHSTGGALPSDQQGIPCTWNLGTTTGPGNIQGGHEFNVNSSLYLRLETTKLYYLCYQGYELYKY